MYIIKYIHIYNIYFLKLFGISEPTVPLYNKQINFRMRIKINKSKKLLAIKNIHT